jgi:hypothetical protein
MKRSLLAIAAAGVLALVLAGGTFFALKLTASGATVGPISVASIPGNPASGVSGDTLIMDCPGLVGCPAGLTFGAVGPVPFAPTLLPVTGILPWDFPAMSPPAYVAMAYFGAANCDLTQQLAVLVSDPLGPVKAADLRLKNGATKTGVLITPANAPYVGGTALVQSAGVLRVGGDFQCGDNVDSDADGAINDGCGIAVVAETICNEAACVDADGQRPWDACDDDADGAINDGCATVGATPEIFLVPDALNNQYLACGNVGGAPVTGWDGKLTNDWKLKTFNFAIDADPWNGTAPCNPIDDTNTVIVGSNHDVAVCTENEPQKGAGGADDANVFTFFLNWDPLLNQCKTDPACPAGDKCLDDNPDVNAGSTLGAGHVPTTPNLGGGWDCSGFGLIQPTCGSGQAKADCLSSTGPYTSGGLSPFPLAIVSLKAILAGTDTIVTSGTVWSGVENSEVVAISVSADVEKVPPPPDTPTPTLTPVPPTLTPTLTPTNTPVPPTPTPTNTPAGVIMEKDCDTDTESVQTECNLWLMDPALGCPNATEGKGCLVVDKLVSGAFDGVSPNTHEIEGVGTWEEQIKYDHKIVRLDAVPDNAWLESGGRIANCSMTILTENWILTGCVTKDDPLLVGLQKGPTNGAGLIEKITVNPMTDDLIYRQGFRPGKDNGVVTDLVDENCELANTLGEKLPGELPGGLTQICGDVHITVRMLEGDLNLDCAVTVVDDQAIAFRYGTIFGMTLYDEWYDLAPECVNGVCYGVPDFDIDIKDLQFVFGRNYSTCQAPIPADQTPVAPPQP